MKKISALLLAVTLLFTLLADFGSKESIVVCASSEQFRNDALQEQLQERFPSQNVIVMYMSTGKAAAKIKFTAEPVNAVKNKVELFNSYIRKITDTEIPISPSAPSPVLTVTQRVLCLLQEMLCRRKGLPTVFKREK